MTGNKEKPISHLPQMKSKRSQKMYVPYTVSVVFHLIFFSILIFLPGLRVPSRASHSIIRVDMVTPPAKGTSISARSRTAAKRSVPTPKKTSKGVSLKTASTKKTSKGNKKKPASDKVKNTINEMKNEADTSRPSDVISAIEQIKNQVEETDAKRRSVENSNDGLAGVESGVPGGSGTGAGGPVDIYTMYILEIRDIVQENWAYPESLADAKSDLETLLVFEVLPNGQVKDIRFTEKSGNKYLDESAYKAVMKSNPFPPYPRELSRPEVEVPLRFSPKGLME